MHQPHPPTIPPGDLVLANRFEQIYLSTYTRLDKFVNHFIRNSDAAQDILQDTYLQLWERMEEINNDEKILTLLRTYATHRMINLLKKTARERKRAEIFHAHQEVITTTDAALDLKETMQEYQQVISQLTDQQQTIFRLRTEEGLSYQEIAERVGSTPRTVKYHLTEARKWMRMHFTADKLAVAMLLYELQK